MRATKLNACLPLAALCLLAGTIAPVHADTIYTYVGRYAVGDGPFYATNPQVYSGRDAAALIYGGLYTDYAISTNADTVDPTTINHMAYLDGWGDGTYLFTPLGEDYKLDLGNPGYNDPGGGGDAYSAYVLDHGAISKFTYNYVWRAEEITAAPTPSTALGGLALMGVIGIIKLRRKESAVD